MPGWVSKACRGPGIPNWNPCWRLLPPTTRLDQCLAGCLPRGTTLGFPSSVQAQKTWWRPWVHEGAQMTSLPLPPPGTMLGGAPGLLQNKVGEG